MYLYEIDNQILACLSAIVDEETGEIIGEDIDLEKLNQLQIERDIKLENIACWYKNLKAEAEAIHNEEKALSRRRKSIENHMERLQDTLNNSLNGEKFKTAKTTISYRSSTSVKITDIELLDNEYLNIELTANRTAIKKALQDGKEITGAFLEKKKNISIK